MLATASSTELGTLVVKGAEIVVDFELTSSATKSSDTVDATGPTLGAKTLSLALSTQSNQSEDRKLNKANIKLSIVSVVEKMGESTKARIEKLTRLIVQLKAILAKLPKDSRSSFTAMLAHAEASLGKGKADEAQDHLIELLVQLSQDPNG